MSSAITFRPRFKLELDLTPDEIRSKIDEHLSEDNPNDVRWRHIGGHIFFRTKPEDRHFWTPQMDVSMEEMEDGRTLMRVLIAPMPAVWTLYVFLYAVLGLGGLVALMAGFSQWALDHTPWAWYFIPVSVIGSILMIFFAKFGQRLAHEEMQLLKGIIVESLGIAPPKTAEVTDAGSAVPPEKP